MLTDTSPADTVSIEQFEQEINKIADDSVRHHDQRQWLTREGHKQHLDVFTAGATETDRKQS